MVAEWLGYSPLLHLDTYTKAVYSSASIPASYHYGTNSRPDFIGLRRDGRFGVFESKGRAKSSSSKQRQDAKTQTQTINKINGYDPVGRFACITYLGAAQLATEVIAPISALDGAPDIVPEPGWIAEHYTLVASLLGEEPQRAVTMNYDGEDFKVIAIEELDLYFGISTSVLKAARERDDKGIVEYVRRRVGAQISGMPEEQETSFDKVDEELEKGGEAESFAFTIQRNAKSEENSVVPEGCVGVSCGVDGHIVLFGQSWKKPRMRRRKFPRPKPEVDG